MNQEQLKIMSGKKGLVTALDQSGGSMPRAFKGYGTGEDQYSNNKEMFNLAHETCTKIIANPSFTSDRILTAILFKDTMERKVGDKLATDYLQEEKRIIPILEVNKSLAEEADGVGLTKPIPGLGELLGRVVEHHIFGIKMRSMIEQANPAGVKEIMDQQFETGLCIAAPGLVSILEPEIDIYSLDKAESEQIMEDETKRHPVEPLEDTKSMFKLFIPGKHGSYSGLMKDSHVVRVVALSGGYSRQEANERLSRSPRLITSFSRTLFEGLNANQIQGEFDHMLVRSIKEVYEASIT